MFAWHASKGQLEGDPVAVSMLNHMSANELYEERNKPNWYVIDVTTPGKYKNMKGWLPAKMISVPFAAKGDSISKIVTTISMQRKRYPQTKILLIADDNNIYAQIDARLQKSSAASGYLRLEGGIRGYQEHIARQMALWSEQNKPRRYEACRG